MTSVDATCARRRITIKTNRVPPNEAKIEQKQKIGRRDVAMPLTEDSEEGPMIQGSEIENPCKSSDEYIIKSTKTRVYITSINVIIDYS